MKKFTANGWQTAMPENWVDRSMITIVGETGASGIAANIVVTHEIVEENTLLEDYAAVQKEGMLTELKTLEILDERSAEINGLKSFQRLQRFSIEGLNIQQVQTFILQGNMIFAITGTAAIEDFNNSINAFREFTENFRLTN
jgi:hypothetical protein